MLIGYDESTFLDFANCEEMILWSGFIGIFLFQGDELRIFQNRFFLHPEKRPRSLYFSVMLRCVCVCVFSPE